MADNCLRSNWQVAESEAMRLGFGRGLLAAGRTDARVVVLSADLMESVGFGAFAAEFGSPRTIEVGVAEQHLVTMASGLAAMGAVPFAGSYAAFSPGRNWEQIRTTICLNDRPVKLVGSHAGLNVGPDGATHQMLEDIALMRALPNMVVLAPGDAHEAELMVAAMVADQRPNYVRLPREATPLFLAHQSFTIGKGYVLREGNDVALIGTGTMTYQLLRAAEQLAASGVQAAVLHLPTIKPLDEAAVLQAAEICGRVVVAEEAQIAGGLGGAVAELLGERLPLPLLRLGVRDAFGESGAMAELWHKHGLDVDSLAQSIHAFVARVPAYRPGF
ncbi:MAG: transketolase C-terminal domain-containing protein [Candidatus Saccharibacteria bacterium]|nr:transketolase C-terminal domain-containing protein [Candidatus Saccharibacteria bacterium]